MPDVILGEFTTDLTPPEVTNPSPANGAVGVLKNAFVEFDITDLEAGVDTASIDVVIGGVDAIVGGVFQTPDYDGTITDMGGGTWHVTISTHPDLPSYTTITATVDGQDLAPLANVMTQYSWSFTTVDYEGPYVDVGYAPTGTGVAVTALISFDLKDDGAGVDINSVVVTVGGVEAYNGLLVTDDPDVGFQAGFQGALSAVTGTPAAYHFVIDASPDYAEFTAYEVIVNASDLSYPVDVVHRFRLDNDVGSSFYCENYPLVHLDMVGAGVSATTSGKFLNGVQFVDYGDWRGNGALLEPTTIDPDQKLQIVLNGTAEFSVGFWMFTPPFNPLSRSPNRLDNYVGKGSIIAGTLSWEVARYVGATPDPNDGKITIRHTTSGAIGTLFESFGPAVLVDNAWHHFCLTRQGSEMKLYLDGLLYMQHSCPASLYLSSGKFHFGGLPDTGTGMPNAHRSDHLEIWDRALTPGEAKAVSLRTW